jgi:MFS family permease
VNTADPRIVEDEGFATFGEMLRRVALGMTACLLAMRPYWTSEDAATGSGLSWVAATLVVAGIAIIGALFTGRFRFRWSLVDLAFLVLIAIVGSTSFSLRLNDWILPGAADRRAAINLSWEWVGLGVMFLLVRNLPRTKRETSALAGVLVATAVAIAAFGVYQGLIELPDLQRKVMANPDWARRSLGIQAGTASEAAAMSRILSSKEPFATFALANSLAGFLVGPLALAFAVAVDNLRREGRGSRALAIGMAVIPGAAMLVCLLLTKSRSAYIGLFVALVILGIQAWLRVSKKTLIIASGVLGVVLVIGVAGLASIGQLDREVITESSKSLKYRLEYWQATWNMLTNAEMPFAPKGASAYQVGADLPIQWPERYAFWRGVGPGNFAGPYLRHKLPQASEEILDPHNMILDVWTTAGLPAVITFLTALGLGIWQIFRPAKSRDEASANPESSESAIKPRSFDPPVQSGWILFAGAMSWVAVVVLGKLNPFDTSADLFARWIILGVAWLTAIFLGGMLWKRREIPAIAAGVGLIAVAVNLLAAGGIGMPAVALAFWVLLAIGLNLRVDLKCGELREKRGLGMTAGTALVWAGTVGAFVGAIGPFWVSETLRLRGEVSMAQNPPAFELARADFLKAIETDKANAKPLVDLAQLEYLYWLSPESRARKESWERVFLTLDTALEAPWRDPNSLEIRRMQATFAKLMAPKIESQEAVGQNAEKAQGLRILSLRSKRLRALRHAAQLYPTNADLRAQLAVESAGMSMYSVAVDEANVALKLSEITPHAEKKLPEAAIRDLKAKLPEWTELRDNPPKPPTAAELQGKSGI